MVSKFDDLEDPSQNSFDESKITNDDFETGYNSDDEFNTSTSEDEDEEDD